MEVTDKHDVSGLCTACQRQLFPITGLVVSNNFVREVRDLVRTSAREQLTPQIDCRPLPFQSAYVSVPPSAPGTGPRQFPRSLVAGSLLPSNAEPAQGSHKQVSRELHGPLRRFADKSGLNRMVRR